MELKEISEQIAKTWEEMKAKNDEVLAEAKKVGEGRAEDKGTIERLNQAMDEQKAKLDEMGLAIERQKLVLPGEAHQESEETKAYKSAFYKWIRDGSKGMGADDFKVLKNALPAERKALIENTAGLYLVPEDMESEIMRAVPQINTLRNYCRIRTTSRDKVKINSATEVSVGWGKLETGTEITESTPTPSQDTIYVEDLYGLTKVGEDELQDTDANLQAMLSDSFAVAIANEEAKRFAIGRGHTTYSEPDGVAVDSTLRTSLGSGCGAGDSATYGISWATDDIAIPDDMLKCEYNLPTQYLKGATWLMHRKTELELRLVKASTSGVYFWQPSLIAGEPNNFDGYPIINQNDMNYPDDEAAATNVVFGNFKLGYMIVDRAGIALQRLDELYAEAGLIGFKVHKRVGGGVYRWTAFFIIVNDV